MLPTDIFCRLSVASKTGRKIVENSLWLVNWNISIRNDRNIPIGKPTFFLTNLWLFEEPLFRPKKFNFQPISPHFLVEKWRKLVES